MLGGDDTIARKEREAAYNRLARHNLGRDPSQILPYVILLVVAKALRASSMNVAVGVLHDSNMPVPLYVFCLFSIAAMFFLARQRPWKAGKRIQKAEWIRIGFHSVLVIVAGVLWHTGLKYFGPTRSIIASDYAGDTLKLCATVFVSSNSHPGKSKGVFFVAATYFILMWTAFFHPHSTITQGDTANTEQAPVDHSILFGLSESVLGFTAVFLSIIVTALQRKIARKLAVEIGGAKRLQALTQAIAAALLFPVALLNLTSATPEVRATVFSSAFVGRVTYAAFFLVVVNYYVDSVTIQRLDNNLVVKLGLGTSFCVAYFLELSSNGLANYSAVLCAVLMLIGMHILLGGHQEHDSVRSMSAGHIPAYRAFTQPATRTSTLATVRTVLYQIVTEKDSRKIFMFLCINLLFMFVELIYGFWTNSLSLISDAFHMLFDCTALLIALYCSVVAKWKAYGQYTYGYGRFEVVSGFVNSVFLVFISIFVLIESVERLFDPPDVSTDRLFLVAVLGLGVNLVGIFAFHGHGHGGHGHSHGGGHGHSHGGGGGDGDSSGDEDGEAHANMGMHGVFLHILADTMGSVGVIISSLLIEYFGLNISDPITSIIISVLIFASVKGLLVDSTYVLLQCTPPAKAKALRKIERRILALNGVVAIREPHFWQHCDDVIVGSCHVQVTADADEQRVLTQVHSMLGSVGVTNLTVQVEKDAFFSQTAHFMSSVMPAKAANGTQYPADTEGSLELTPI